MPYNLPLLPPTHAHTLQGLKRTGEEDEEKTSEAGSEEYQESFQELPLLQVRRILRVKYEVLQCRHRVKYEVI